MSSGPLLYEPFFGLRKKPFSLAADPEFLYETPSHTAALEVLLAGIRRREGLLALTGDVGTGKTTICRAVLRNLDRKTFSAFVPDPFASREDLLKILLIEFGVASIQDFTTGQLAHATRTDLSYLLSSFLDTLVPLDAFVVVFIDEAQNMSLPLIEEVRVLSDAFKRHGQLQLVFVGQLELLDKLKSPAMRQVDQRISIHATLDPLVEDNVIGYVHHRLQIAGGVPGRPGFDPGAMALLHEASGGVPRLINRLCDRALHAAYLRRSSIVSRSLLATVLDRPVASAVAPAVESPDPPTPEALSLPGSDGAFATKVDAWLNQLDGGTAAADAGTLELAPLAVPADLTMEVPPAPPAHAPDGNSLRRGERRSPRANERVGYRWARSATIGIITLLSLKLIMSAMAVVPQQLNAMVEPEALPSLPASPVPDLRPVTLPEAPAFAPASTPTTVASRAPEAMPDYVIAVGAFSSAERADRLVDALGQAGHQAFRREAPTGGRLLQQVLVGPFESRAAAGVDLDRIRENGGYTDARILPLHPVRN